MTTFESVHSDAITGKLAMFARLLFKGYLGLMSGETFERFLHSLHVLLKDFGDYSFPRCFPRSTGGLG